MSIETAAPDAVVAQAVLPSRRSRQSAAPAATTTPTVVKAPAVAVNTPAAPAPSVAYRSPYAAQQVSFARMVKSEWLKFWTLRSTWWVVSLTVVLMAGFALMFAAIMRVTLTDPDTLAAMAAADPHFAADPGGAGMGLSFSTVNVITLGIQFAQLTVAVLGVLMITNEYSSGMIRATFSAAPRRGRVLLAKLLVLLTTTAGIAVLGIALGWLVTRPVLSGVDAITPIDFSDGADVRALFGAVLYLMAIATLSLALGALIRATAGAIFTVVALLMVLPMIFQIILVASNATWAQTINRFLPSVAGERIFQGDLGAGMFGELLSPWAGFAVLAGYAVVAYLAAVFLIRRRDA